MDHGGNQIYQDGKRHSWKCTLRRQGSLGFMTKRGQRYMRILSITKDQKVSPPNGITTRTVSQLLERISPLRRTGCWNLDKMLERTESPPRVISSCWRCTNSWMQHRLLRSIKRMCRGASSERHRFNRIRRLVSLQRKVAQSRVSKEHRRVVSWKRR